MTPRRGEIWWVRLDPAQGSEIRKTRPCVVLTANPLNERRRTVVVIPLTTSPQASPPILVRVQCGGKPAIAVVDQVRAVSKERLEARIGLLTADELSTIEESLLEVLDLG